MASILVTGGAGFIGSSFVRSALNHGARVVVYDALTYAGHMPNIEPVLKPGVCDFIQGNICDFEKALSTLKTHKIESIIHFAAESHVDNSIHGPQAFIETNIVGTFQLLEAAREYFKGLTADAQKKFRFVHISTDEVFGELGETGHFTEETAYHPNSPYSATKAGSDHLARAWHHTYKLPTLVTNCSNNYGPRQFPEKLIPRMITCALAEKPLPVYGKGENVRDWIHVDDHAEGIWLALTQGEIGGTYCFGGRSERKNIDVVKAICSILDEHKPRAKGRYSDLITFVEDRAGHDWRYAIDDTHAEKILHYKRTYKSFEDGLKQTVKWYLENPAWLNSVMEKKK